MASLAVRSLLSRQLQRRLPTATPSIAENLVPPSSVLCPPTIVSFGVFAEDRSIFRRYFSSDDKGSKPKGASESSSASSPPAVPSAVDYDIEEIMSTFGDTSYYDPVERPDYSHMTNEELKDSSTIPGWDLIHSPPKDKETIPRGALVGRVVSTKMTKTINVEVDRYKIHRKYHKRLRYSRKFMAHDETEVADNGDLVMIVPCQRISKHKHFMLREIIRARGQL